MNRNKNIFVIKLLIIIFILILFTILIEKIMAKFETFSNSSANIQTAFYVIGDDYQSMNLCLDAFQPQDNLYYYSFSVSNFKDGKLIETNAQYQVIVTTTTNLPLTINLYKVQNDQHKGAESILRNSETIIDEYGTYFRRFTTNMEGFGHYVQETNTYTLEIEFPLEYKESDIYSDVIEGIEIVIDSKQAINE